MTITPGWRTGTGGRTLYRDGRLVGMLDTPELADLVVRTLTAAAGTAGITHALTRMEQKIMSALSDLQAANVDLAAADATLTTAVTGLAAEQVTFLTDIAAAIAAAGTDPAALAAVTADINARAADLRSEADAITALTAGQVAADPATPPAG